MARTMIGRPGKSRRPTGRRTSATLIGTRIRLEFGVLLLLATMGAHDARALDVLFPAYANPCCGGGPAMWAALISTAATPARPFGLHVVFNPASGPGVAVDPNYVDANGLGPLPDLRAAGAVVYGYVTTGYGARAAADVLADIDAYLVGHYAGRVDGIFFDEVSSDLAQVGANRTYVARVQAQEPGARTIGNPGITAIQNPSGQTTWTAADYAAVFDVLVTFEQTGAEYRSSYSPPVYLAARPASGFAHLIHSDGPFDPTLLALAASRKAGLVFVSDDVMPNPYDLLPSYWAVFVAAITAFDAAPVPTASPLARVALGLAVLVVGARASRARRSPFRSPSDRRRPR
ncbi:MAG: spherulation-specific family 4 protein [Deltaproteobacteria bacterium]|nr:spherulation-specific family 4 protein [Deltaproteobacteria bacterium]